MRWLERRGRDHRNRNIAVNAAPIDLDLDRQKFPFLTPEGIDAHVREAVETLGSRQGGLWLKVEVGDDVPLKNVEALCQSLERYRDHYA